MKVGIFQEQDGSFSMRRVLAFLSWIVGVGFSFFAVQFISAGWIVFIPAIICFALSALMPMLTTIADIKSIVETIKVVK